MTSYHVHAINWNESRLLPVFFRHYASADKIYIHDNESDADTIKMVSGYRGEIVPFSTGGTFDDATHQRIKNSVWKRSKGEADFVIVQDLDELVHFPWAPGDIKAALTWYRDLGITCAQSQCYCIVCSDEDWEGVLSSQAQPWTLLRRGFKGDLFTGANYDKVQVFSPGAISETNFSPGAPEWRPLGNIHAAPLNLQPIMLHCKHIGMKHEVGRRQAMSRRMSEANKRNSFSWQYNAGDDELARKVHAVYASDKIEDISRHLDRGGELWLSEDWTSGLQKTLELLYKSPQQGPFKVLEVGCFEGRGTLILLDRLCRHKDSVICCVDPWMDVYVLGRPEFAQFDRFFNGQHMRFLFNTRLAQGKVRALKGLSDAILPNLDELFDLVYIDGDHHPDQVYFDAVMALRLTKPGGVIVFDDYEWVQNGVSPKPGIDRFVSEFSTCVTIIHKGSQLVVKMNQVWAHPTTARAKLVDGLPTVLVETWGHQDIISRITLDGGTWEPNVALTIANYFKGKPKSVMLDVGANIGSHSLAAVKAGAAHVFAFECHPITASKLSRTVQLNRCERSMTVVPLAASDETGKVVRLGHVPSNVAASFIDSADNRFSPQRTDVYECGTVALDDFAFSPELDTFNSVFVKLDVEGHELQAIRGMRKVLSDKRVDCAIVELNPFTASKETLSLVIDELASFGFKNLEVLFSVPPDQWAAGARHVSQQPTARAISKGEAMELIGRDVILEVVIRRPSYSKTNS